MKEKFQNLIKELDEKIVEHENENRMLILGTIAGENILMLGPTGTAKSLSARAVCNAIENGVYFEKLLTPHTTPDELFGPISIKALEEDKYERKTDNYLPTAHIAFIDEIFKANSAILNNLLTIINEKKFHNGNNVQDVPLISLIAASNEKPNEDDQSLIALYDRFLIRLYVDYVQNENLIRKMLFENTGERDITTKMSVSEILEIQKKAKVVSIPMDIQDTIINIKNKLKDNKIIVSDRRWNKIIWALKVSAAINDRDYVDESDLLLMKYFIIEDPNQDILVSNLIHETITTENYMDERTKILLKNPKRSNKIKVTLRDYNYTTTKSIEYVEDSTKIVYTQALKNAKIKLEKALEKLNERRRKLRSMQEENILLHWITATELIKPIDEEIANINTNIKNIEDALQFYKEISSDKVEKISMKCPHCNKMIVVNITNNSEEINCPSCGRYLTLEVKNEND